MKNKLTNVQVQDFLLAYSQDSQTVVLDEGKQKSELLESARKRGIIISKNDKDLGVIKSIYCFTTKANANKHRLPQKEFMKIMPQIIGRPMNLGHDRTVVLGFYIDYQYILAKEEMIIYAIFFKDYYPKLWKKAKDFQKKKKLSSSYEIWSPEEKRELLSDGTYLLHDIGIAGGALIFEEYGDKPAFKDAKVLSISSKIVQESIDKKCLVYASKYKENEIITSEEDYFKKSVTENYKKIQEEKKPEPKVEVKKEVKVEEPKKEEKPVEVKPSEKKPEVKPVEEKPKLEQPIVPKIKCSNCGHEWQIGTTREYAMGSEKCPKCFAILDQSGKMIYPPQIKDFRIACPSCSISNWLILSNKEDTTKLRCLGCSKEYDVGFAKEKDELANTFNFIYMGSTTCHQCGKRIDISGTSKQKNYNIKCSRCGLEFTHNTSHKQYRKISKLTEIIKSDEIVKSSEKGGTKTMEFKLETSKYHRYVDDFDKLEATLSGTYGKSMVVAQRLTYEQRKALPDNMFAVVVRVKDKRTGKMRKIRMYPINDEAHVRNALARLGQPAPQATLKRLGISIEKVRAKILRRARQLNMTTLLERYKKSPKVKSALPKEVTDCVKRKTKEGIKPADAVKECWAEYKKVKEQSKAKETPKVKVEKPKAEETPKAKVAPKSEVKPVKAVETTKPETVDKENEKLLKTAIRKQAKRIISLKKGIKKTTEDLEKKVEFYKVNAGEINKRREVLGKYSVKLSDVEILDDNKFAQVSAIKENDLITGKEIVGDKRKDDAYWSNIREKVDEKAFGKKKKK